MRQQQQYFCFEMSNTSLELEFSVVDYPEEYINFSKHVWDSITFLADPSSSPLFTKRLLVSVSVHAWHPGSGHSEAQLLMWGCCSNSVRELKVILNVIHRAICTRILIKKHLSRLVWPGNLNSDATQTRKHVYSFASQTASQSQRPQLLCPAWTPNSSPLQTTIISPAGFAKGIAF